MGGRSSASPAASFSAPLPPLGSTHPLRSPCHHKKAWGAALLRPRQPPPRPRLPGGPQRFLWITRGACESCATMLPFPLKGFRKVKGAMVVGGAAVAVRHWCSRLGTSGIHRERRTGAWMEAAKAPVVVEVGWRSLPGSVMGPAWGLALGLFQSALPTSSTAPPLRHSGMTQRGSSARGREAAAAPAGCKAPPLPFPTFAPPLPSL